MSRKFVEKDGVKYVDDNGRLIKVVCYGDGSTEEEVRLWNEYVESVFTKGINKIN